MNTMKRKNHINSTEHVGLLSAEDYEVNETIY